MIVCRLNNVRSFRTSIPRIFPPLSYLAAIWVLISAAALVLFAARASCQVGSKISIDGDSSFSPSIDRDQLPSIAFDGANYLVAWEMNESRVVFARVSPGGNVLNAPPVVLANGHAPAVAFDGTNYFVVWSNNESGFYDIYGARVTPAGSIVDPGGILIARSGGQQFYPAIAFDGQNYLVAWEAYYNGSYNIYGRRVSQSGAMLDAAWLEISTAARDQSYPACAYDSTNFVVVWQDSRGTSTDIYGARVSSLGIVLDPAGIPISTQVTAETSPAIAGSGRGFLVTWSDARNGSFDIYGARLSRSAVVIDVLGIPISTAPFDQSCPVVCVENSNPDNPYFVVSWQDYRNLTTDVYGTRVDLSGTVLDGSGIAISTGPYHQASPAIAFDGANCLVVWQNWRSQSSSDTDISGARVAQSGTVLDNPGFNISVWPNIQDNPVAAYDGNNYFVVWRETRLGPSGLKTNIYGRWVSPSGTAVGTASIAISTGTNVKRDPAVAFDGTNFLVVWAESTLTSYYDIYGARVSTSGSVLDSPRITISAVANSYESNPAVAFGGGKYLVVWVDGYHAQIRGARVDTSGTVLDNSGIGIGSAMYGIWTPAVAFNGTNYVVVWVGRKSMSLVTFDIDVKLVAPSGAVSGGGSITHFDPYYTLDPAIASNTTNCLALWSYLQPASYDIFGARVDSSGQSIDGGGKTISNTSYRESYPGIAFDGEKYVAVWYTNEASHHVSAVWISQQGEVLNGSGTTISPTGGHPDIARGPAGNVLIVYADTTQSPTGIVNRISGNLWLSSVAVGDGGNPGVPFGLPFSPMLERNFPNPFGKTTSVRYGLASSGEAKLVVYSLKGAVVRVLASGTTEAGWHQSDWDGRNSAGRLCPSGVYILRLDTGGLSATRKLVLLR